MKNVFALLSVFVACHVFAGRGVNPILPLWEHVPDGEPYVFEDPDCPGKMRLYLYGSHDIYRNAYCGNNQVVWSASVDDLTNWRYDGIAFVSKCGADGKPLHENDGADTLYAPDVAVVKGKDGRNVYYFYPNTQNASRESMVAKSDRPDGPFTVCNWDPSNPKATVGVLGFDPAVFVDDDGRVYGFWGFERSYAAELDPSTMATVKSGTKIVVDLLPSRLGPDARKWRPAPYRDEDVVVANEKMEGPFRFYEASSLRKIKDKYIFVYSRWTDDGEFGLYKSNYTLAWAYAENPLGPYTYGGTLIDGRGRETLPDGSTLVTAVPRGNTHGGIVEIKGQWYVFYHRQTGTTEYARQAMVAPVDVQVEEGPGGKVMISEGEYTSEGFNLNGLELKGAYPAGIASHLTGAEPIKRIFDKGIDAKRPRVAVTYYDGDVKCAPDDIALGSNPVVNIRDGATVGYKYFNFDSASRDTMELSMRLKSLASEYTIKVYAGRPYIDGEGQYLGSVSIIENESGVTIDKKLRLSGLSKIKGKKALYFVFSSKTADVPLCEFHSFSFSS